MKWMRRVNAWGLAGVADPGYGCAVPWRWPSKWATPGNHNS